MRHRRTRFAAATMALAVGVGYGVATTAAAGAAANRASAPGVTAKQIIIGLVTSETGPAAANFNGAVQGADARFKLQNAQGGVNGRKI
ncbi:MAG TPA: ABC transporter substrate-binding protein, partial [Acidimicrobiales bacterium]|nr:ABC transporter substrate-binding protein [Acidimicrobiales bacterium]